MRRIRPVRATSKLALEQLEERIAPATVFWDGGAATTNWSDSANWSANTVPGSGDDVVIGQEFANLNIVSSQSQSIRSLTSSATLVVRNGILSISAPSVTRGLTLTFVSSLQTGTLSVGDELIITDSFSWMGGRLEGNGVTRLTEGAVGSISGQILDKRLAGRLENAGELTYDGSRLVGSGTATRLVNLPGGTLALVGDGDFTGQGQLVNQGLLTRSGAGITSLTAGADLRNEGGTIEIWEGVFETTGGIFSGSGVIASGAVRVPAGTLSLADGATVSGPGAIELTGGTLDLGVDSRASIAELDVLSGTVSLAADAQLQVSGDLTLISGTVNTGAGAELVAKGEFSWSGGTIMGAGVTRLAEGGLGTISGNSQKRLSGQLESAGELTYTEVRREIPCQTM